MAESLKFTCDVCGKTSDPHLARGEQEPGPGQAGPLGALQAADPIGTTHGMAGLPPNWLYARVIRSTDTEERVAVDLQAHVCSYDCLEKTVKARKQETASERAAVTKRLGL